MAVKRGLHSQFLTLANSRAPCGGIRNYPECGKVTVKNPTWRKKKYKMKKKKEPSHTGIYVDIFSFLGAMYVGAELLG